MARKSTTSKRKASTPAVYEGSADHTDLFDDITPIEETRDINVIKDSNGQKLVVHMQPQHINYVYRGSKLDRYCPLEYAVCVTIGQKRKRKSEEEEEEEEEVPEMARGDICVWIAVTMLVVGCGNDVVQLSLIEDSRALEEACQNKTRIVWDDRNGYIVIRYSCCCRVVRPARGAVLE
jgi:hypothetical protein